MRYKQNIYQTISLNHLFQQLGLCLKVRGHAYILAAQAANVMGAEGNLYFIVAVKPLWMMIHFLS